MAAAAGLDAYLDPTPDVLHAKTQELVEKVLVPLQRHYEEVPHDDSPGEVSSFVRRLRRFPYDEDVFGKALREFRRELKGRHSLPLPNLHWWYMRHPRARQEETLSYWKEWAEQSCRGREIDECDPSLRVDEIWTLPKERLRAVALPEDLEPVRSVAAKSDTRRGRLSLALEMESPLSAFRFALLELTSDVDPRKWDPDDIALLIVKARELDTWKPPPAPPHKPGEPITYHGTDHSPLPPKFDRLYRIFLALKPMGLMRAYDLIRPVSLRPEQVQIVWRLTPGWMDHDWNHHFPFEEDLYEAEYKKTPWAVGISLDEFVRKRWTETDQAAPHPDLQRIEKALAKRMAGGPRRSCLFPALTPPTKPSAASAEQSEP